MHPADISSGYDLQIIVRRCCSTIVDYILAGSFVFVPHLILDEVAFQKTATIWIGLAFAYFPLFETMYGRTPGKFVAGIVVVTEVGLRPCIEQALIRTCFRLLEVNPVLLGGLPAGIAAISSRSRQRLGDMVAKTYVLYSEDLSKSQSFTESEGSTDHSGQLTTDDSLRPTAANETGGLNFRISDNVLQVLSIIVCVVVGNTIGRFVSSQPGGSMAGGFIGLLVGLFGSGIYLMVARKKRD